MTDAVNAIGFVGSILTIVSFFQANFPAHHPEGPTVNIKAGLPPRDKEADSLAGNIKHVYSFDERNAYGGQSDGCHIDSGGLCTKVVDQPVPGRRAHYISVSNDNDATCIAWITVQQYDNTRGGAWTGDIGYNCSQYWYNSVEKAGKSKSGEDYIPKCTWLDALKFDIEAYGEKNAQDTINNNHQCEATIYGKDSGPIAGAPAKRSTKDHPEWMKEQLFWSNYTSQPAEELCSSATSWGPDFIGLDGQFCDMGSKTLTPLCSVQNAPGCIIVDEA